VSAGLPDPSRREELVRAAANDVADPCSVGRGVPAGLLDMGMVVGVEVGSEPGWSARGVEVELQLTSPACTFQLYFDRSLRERLERLGFTEVEELRIEWCRAFDWSDDEMSDDLKRRLREKRRAMLAAAGRQV
jgi:metal-sulfur cluster biosynthetic enzyme